MLSAASYTEAPPPSWPEVLLCRWTFVGPADRPLLHRVPPDGCVNLVRTPAGLMVMGPRTSPCAIELPPSSRVVGLRLRPDAARAVLGVPGRALRDVLAPLETAVPGAAFRWDDEAPPVFSPDLDALDLKVRAAIAYLIRTQGQGRVGEVAHELGWSLRHLERRFGEDVGLSVKAFARIVRLRHALVHHTQGDAPSWAAVALDAGYADQSHLVRETTALLGVPPEAAQLRTMVHQGVQPGYGVAFVQDPEGPRAVD